MEKAGPIDLALLWGQGALNPPIEYPAAPMPHLNRRTFHRNRQIELLHRKLWFHCVFEFEYITLTV